MHQLRRASIHLLRASDGTPDLHGPSLGALLDEDSALDPPAHAACSARNSLLTSFNCARPRCRTILSFTVRMTMPSRRCFAPRSNEWPSTGFLNSSASNGPWVT